MYKEVKEENLIDEKDQPNDINGYIGFNQYYRVNLKLVPISEQEFIKIIQNDDKGKVFFYRNGLVIFLATNTICFVSIKIYLFCIETRHFV